MIDRWLIESKFGGVIIGGFMVILVGGFLGLVYYMAEARRERQAHQFEMLGIARDVILDSMKNEQECRERLKEAEANRHPFSEFWDKPYEGEAN